MKQFFSHRHAVIAVLVSLMVSQAAGAASDVNAVINGQEWYSQDDFAAGCSTGSGSGSDSNVAVSLVGSDNMSKIWNFFISKGLTPVQTAGLMGNLQAESALDPQADQQKGKASTPTDGDGFGLVQWTYAVRQKPLVAYAAAMQPPQAVDTLEAQLPFIWHELNSSDFVDDFKVLQSATDVPGATSAIMNGTLAPMGAGHKPGFQVYEAPASIGDPAATAARTKLSQKIYSLMSGGGTSANPSAAATGCGGAQGAVQGSITKTAMSAYTWPKPDCSQTADNETRSNCHDARAAYKTDIVNPGGLDALTDCGTFVSTVMRKSGVDANYPVVSTGTQITYLRDHPEKYHITESPKSTKQLTSGDILIWSEGSSGHTMIYLGEAGGAYPRADASLHGHTPQMNTPGGVDWMFQHSNMLAATPIN